MLNSLSLSPSPPPPTHTHTYIYIYIYFFFWVFVDYFFLPLYFRLMDFCILQNSKGLIQFFFDQRGWYNLFLCFKLLSFFVFFRIIWCLLIYISFLLFFFSSYLFQNLNSAISFILLKYLYFLSIFLFKKIKYKIFYLNSNK